jgi:hypothetical protein
MDKEQWVSVSAIGDLWEVEMNVYANPDSVTAYSHRPVSFGGLQTEWQVGRPRTGVHAKPKEDSGMNPGFYWARRKDGESLTVVQLLAIGGVLCMSYFGNLTLHEMNEADEHIEILGRIPEPE